MLFRKKIEPACAYCAFGGDISPQQVICQRKGVVPADHHCAHFRYDPLRRVPPTPAEPDFDQFTDQDFAWED